MFDLSAYLVGLLVVVAITTVIWTVSVWKRDASIIDLFWSVLFIAAGATYTLMTDETNGTRTLLMLVLVSVWGFRLAGYLTWRNWGEEEDFRYQAMRRRRTERWPIVSLYRVFWLQAGLAWIVSAPLLAAADSTNALGIFDYLGIAIWLVGFSFESFGDFQLAQFKANPENEGRVLDTGLWGLTRHPNYFGDFMVWWGFYFIALGAGGWWSIVGPVVMSLLLLRVSGVALLEQTITERRPEYAEYIESVNAFFPGRKRRPTADGRRTSM